MKLEKLLYQISNCKAHWRALYLGSYVAVEGAVAKGIGALGGRTIMEGVLVAKVTRANPKWWQGKTLDLGVVSKRVVTTAGVNYMRDDFNAAAGAELSYS